MCKFANAAGVDPYDKASEAPYEMVSFTNSFHGRTLGALALTYKDQYKTPFSPIMPGALMVPYMDLEAAAAVIKKVPSGLHFHTTIHAQIDQTATAIDGRFGERKQPACSCNHFKARGDLECEHGLGCRTQEPS